MKNYHTITRRSAMELDTRVNQYLQVGWILVGGVEVVNCGIDLNLFCQALAWQDDNSKRDFVSTNPVYPPLQPAE